MGFGIPSAYEATGSDLHRAYRARLCCVFRLSQPPDAFLLPEPSRLCFAPLTLMGFHPSEVFPPDPPGQPLGVPAPHDVPRRRRDEAPSLQSVLTRVATLLRSRSQGRGFTGAATGIPDSLPVPVPGVQEPLACLPVQLDLFRKARSEECASGRGSGRSEPLRGSSEEPSLGGTLRRVFFGGNAPRSEPREERPVKLGPRWRLRGAAAGSHASVGHSPGLPSGEGAPGG